MTLVDNCHILEGQGAIFVLKKKNSVWTLFSVGSENTADKEKKLDKLLPTKLNILIR